jgi:putative ABC transport system permease protein
MSSLLRDLFLAARLLRSRKGYAVTVVLTLTLGIGATVTIASFAYALLLRPFPYAEPDRLVRVQSVYTKDGGQRRGASLLDVEDYRRRSRMLSGIGSFTTTDAQLAGDGQADVVAMTQLHPQALALTGVRPVLGRLLLDEEDRTGADVHKAVISYELWQSRFGGDRGVLGRLLRTQSQDYTIVGVLPAGFAFPERTAFWTPMESWYARQTDDRKVKWRGARWYPTVARLAPAVSREQAEAELNGIAASLEREYPKDNEGIRVALTPLREYEVGKLRPYVVTLLAGVGFVLLICCANVANLLLLQAARREREIAVRAALGAGRWDLMRGLLSESLLLAAVGGALGVALAFAGVRGLLALIPARLPFWMRVEIDGTMLLFSVATAGATALLFGLTPALSASRVRLAAVMQEGARGSSGRSRYRSALVVAELSLALVLLAGAVLMVRTFVNLQRIEAGFRGEGVIAAHVVTYAAGTRKEQAAVLTARHERVIEALRRLPGAMHVAVTNSLPYAGQSEERTKADIFIKGRSDQESKMLVPLAGADVSDEYFHALRIPLRRGRLFTPADHASAPMVCIISERAARLYWPNEDPIGKEISWGRPTKDNPYTRVVGVVGNVKHRATEGDNGIEIYYPIAQWPVSSSYYVVRAQGDPVSFADTMRRLIRETDPALAVTDVKTMERARDEALWQRRLWGVLFSAFASLALVLAAVGVYGVMGQAVTARTRELGIRLALGSDPGGVRMLVLRDGLRLVALAMAIGLSGAALLHWTARGLLYGVPALDPATYAGAPLLLAAVALAATCLPANRAAAVDPARALRAE